MKFFTPVLVVSILLATGLWLCWKTPPELIRLQEVVESVAPGEVTEWSGKLPDLEGIPRNRGGEEPSRLFLERPLSSSIVDGEIVKIAGDAGARYFETKILSPKSIWREDRIGSRQKFPFRPLSYVFFAAALGVALLRKFLFRAPKSRVAKTSAGSGYRISQTLLFWGAFLLALPLTYRIGTPLMGASGFVGAILFITGLVCFILFSRSTSKLKDLLEKPEEVLATWNIPREEWKTFLSYNLSKEKKALLIIMTAISVFALFSAYIVSYGEKNSWMVMLTMGLLFGLLWVATVLPTLRKRRRLLAGDRAVTIYPFGVEFGDQIQLWREPNTSFLGASYEDDPVSQIRVQCGASVLTEGGVVPLRRQIVFPVPRGEAGAAAQIVARLRQLNPGLAETQSNEDTPGKS